MSNLNKPPASRRRQGQSAEKSPGSAQPHPGPPNHASDMGVATSQPVAPAVEAAHSIPADPVHTLDHAVTKHHKKSRLLRDSFKFPPEEYSVFEELKGRCRAAGREVKKSELVRAGLLTLKTLTDAKLLEVLGKLKKLKMGRPPKT